MPRARRRRTGTGAPNPAAPLKLRRSINIGRSAQITGTTNRAEVETSGSSCRVFNETVNPCLNQHLKIPKRCSMRRSLVAGYLTPQAQRTTPAVTCIWVPGTVLMRSNTSTPGNTWWTYLRSPAGAGTNLNRTTWSLGKENPGRSPKSLTALFVRITQNGKFIL